MNILDRYKLEQETYKRVIKDISAIKNKELHLEKLKHIRNKKTQKLQIMSLYNMGATCIALIMPAYVKIAIILISITITAFVFFRVFNQIQSLDKKIHEYTQEIISLNNRLAL